MSGGEIVATFIDEGGITDLLFEAGDLWADEGPGDVVVPLPEPVIVLPHVDWTWVLAGTPPFGVGRRELTKAYGRALIPRVDGAWSATFTLDGRSDEALEIQSLATDLIIYREGGKLFRGRISAENDNGDGTNHVTQFTAIDYRGVLTDSRFVGKDGRVFGGVDQGAIAWLLISENQALPGGNLGIIDGAGSVSGTLRDRTYDPGKPIGEAIDELYRVSGGGDWEIDANLALNRYYPRRGTSTGFTLDYKGTVAKFSRLLSSKDFGNSVMATGSQGLTPAVATDPGVSSDPRGLWQRSVGFPSVLEQTTLGTKAFWLLDQTSVLRPEIVVTLTPGRWHGPDELWIGDTAQLALRSGRLADTGDYRVVEMRLMPGDHGTETIQMGLVKT